MPVTRQPLSVAIITLNAASQLEGCLQSARFADEIVVVDSGSTDGTQTLAERYGARLTVVESMSFVQQPAEALAALIPGARLEVFADCAHAPFISRPDDFLACLRAFLHDD